MIISKLIGGLGNQMFQYAVGKQIATSNNTELKLDITGYDHQVGITPRKYMLGVFNIQASIATKKEIGQFKTSSKNMFQRRWYQIKLAFQRRYYIQQSKLYSTHQLLSIPDNSYLEGYWGSEKYFKDIEKIIHKEFTPKEKPDADNQKMNSQIKNCDSVSIHVRRGDYIFDQKTNKYHGVCDLGYYLKAVNLLAKKVENPHFFIFSDDPFWIKENLRLKFPYVFVDHNAGKKDYEDMRLMSKCRHNIIANSSFSWWGAWLNQNPNKIIIAPKQWFNDPKINTKDLLPQSWIKI